jgi:hypothetical protein
MHDRANAIPLPRNTSKIVRDYYNGYFDGKDDYYDDYFVRLWKSKEVFQELIREPLEFFASCKCCDRHQVAKPDSCDVDPLSLIEKHECLLCCNEYFNHESTKCGNPKCGKTFCCKCIHKLSKHTGSRWVRCPYCRCHSESTEKYEYHYKQVFCVSMDSWMRLDHVDCRCGCRKHMRKIITEYQECHTTNYDYDYLKEIIEECYDEYTEQVKNELVSKIYAYSSRIFKKQTKKFNELDDDSMIPKKNVVKLMKFRNKKIRIKVLKDHVEKLVYENPWLTLDQFTVNMVFEPLIMFK